MTRLLCKPGVTFGGFSRALLRVLDVLDQVAGLELPGVPPAITVTAGSNGTHAPHSAHYRFEAVDVRTKDFASAAAKTAFTDLVRRQLGPTFFVDLEMVGMDSEHLHVQLRKGQSYELPAAVAGREVRTGT
jgi:hypothetical protein